MEYIIDSYAWIEYFIASKEGEILKNLILDEKNQFFTVECCLVEINGWALLNNKDFAVILNVLYANSSIIKLTENDWIEAAKERFEQRKVHKDFGLIDAVILTKQKQLNYKIISGDKHFKNLKNVLFIGNRK